jgi:hypothetical protein
VDPSLALRVSVAEAVKLAPRSIRTFVPARPGDSRRVKAHESDCPNGFSIAT